MSLAEIEAMVTVAGVVVAAGSLAFTAYGMRLSVLTNRAMFWLDLRDRFSRHEEAHRRLRPGGAWTNGKGPETVEDWASVEAYMGLFEHCEVMLSERLIDERTFREIYAYRLRNIVANNAIRQTKLRELASGWQRFLGLLERLNIEMPR